MRQSCRCPRRTPCGSKARPRRFPTAPPCSRMPRRSAVFRSVARSRRNCAARSRSNRDPRTSFERRLAIDTSCASGAARGSVRAWRANTTGRRDADADLRDARRRRAPPRSLSPRATDSAADTSDRVSAWRRVVRRHEDDRTGLRSIFRPRRVRDGVDRVPAHAVDHVPRERGGRANGRPVAEGERRRARARCRTHLPVGHLGGWTPGRRRRPGAARDVRGHRQPDLHEQCPLRARTRTVRRASM